jgi:hypothetical protein
MSKKIMHNLKCTTCGCTATSTDPEINLCPKCDTSTLLPWGFHVSLDVLGTLKMRGLQLYDKIEIPVKTPYGEFNVEFTIVDILPDNFYALCAQNRISIGKCVEGNTWKLSIPVDLHELKESMDKWM